MGQQIAKLALLNLATDNHSPIAIGGAVEARSHPAIGSDLGLWLGKAAIGVKITDDVVNGLKAGDVLIEFTNPEATMAHAGIAKDLKKPMVIGTTGLGDDQREVLRRYAKDIPIVLSPNMSVGVNVLCELVDTATTRLAFQGYEISIQETHHAGKMDKPSGTAKRLQELIGAVLGQRPANIPCESTREGDVIGEHAVVIEDGHERIRLSHEALSRDVFARGALEAAVFVSRQQPGLYEMSHVIKSMESAKPHRA